MILKSGQAWATDDGLSDKSALIKCIVLALTRPGIKPTIYQIGDANHYVILTGPGIKPTIDHIGGANHC